MTSIAWNGGPIMRGGQVGSGQACCCDKPPCCITSTNCTITVTVTYSNGQTRTNGENQLDEDGNDISDTPISASINDCNAVSFFHEILTKGTCTQGASKTQRIICATCCVDPLGVGCDCTFGVVVEEDYALGRVEPDFECNPSPTFNYVTQIAFTLTDCGDCPCEFP